MSNLLRDALNKRFAEHPKILPKTPAQVGTKQHQIETGLANMIWVRISDVPVRVYNKIAVVLDEWVWVGGTQDAPQLAQVLGEIPSRPRSLEDNKSAYRTAKHHKNHEYPNADTVWVQTRQFMPLRITAIGGFNIEIFPHIVNFSGTMVYVEKQVLDLSEYRIFADYATKAKYVLIEILPTGVLNAVEGAEVDFSDLALSDIPTATTGSISDVAIQIWAGQTEIKETRAQSDIKDLRFSGIWHDENKSVDGGSSSSVYLPTQSIDGGNA